jgi:putative FmdB family regulatory protein
MPTYVYGCDACGHRFEKFQKFSDDPIRVCPECQSSVRRIFQPAGIVFKGSGWHVTDYKRGGNNGSESAKDGETKAAGNSESKQETPAAAGADSSASATKSEPAKSATGDAAAPAKAAS